MSRVFITGSSDGLGLMAGQLLAARDVKVQDELLDYCAELVGRRLAIRSRVSAQARTTAVPTAAPPTASVNRCAPLATIAAATAVASAKAITTSSDRTAAGTRRHGDRGGEQQSQDH